MTLKRISFFFQWQKDKNKWLKQIGKWVDDEFEIIWNDWFKKTKRIKSTKNLLELD